MSSADSCPGGFVFEIPGQLLRGGSYIPLSEHLPLPGCAVLVQSRGEDGSRLFGRLASRREPFTVTLLRSTVPLESGAIDLHRTGVICIISEHKALEDERYETLIAGIGRVRLGDPYVYEGDELPRVDVTPIVTRSEGSERLQQRLTQLISMFSTSVGSLAPQLASMLHHFAHESHDVSLNIDRVAGVLAHGQPHLAQSFLEDFDLDVRLERVETQLMHALGQMQRAVSQHGKSHLN